MQPTSTAVAEGFVTVDSDPFAVIYIDGARFSETPVFKRKLAAGKHVLRAVLEDGRERTIDIVVEDGKAKNLGKLTW
jgi:hypothetical protein